MLEDAGCQVIYGLPEMKVHSKLCLITRKRGESVQYFTQVGTGNYNEVTSEQYTDLSVITSDERVGVTPRRRLKRSPPARRRRRRKRSGSPR